ncbi:hypothetical protein BKP35_01705 [Anaerobacillus arseniciselenatis]|uniref:N-acetyltransferase domain-containing protein n=1 Tax=Anaerobacillus arseniciselenatis TaxID=85682 RepID=A0A1S2LT89_9BACI|nr:GNAT family N-acetyltransferase [Anaerobacillus arseniciselenatis]OIJ15732.1 hypothetical protein BKP35_01705 [Anaerobacillus arseniciselenatis]
MLFFETDRLILRPFELKDAQAVENLAKDKELARTTMHIPHPFPEGLAELWIERYNEKINKGSSYCFAIILKGTMELVGCVMLYVALNHKRGELAYWIGKDYWDNGFATEASRKMMEFAFEKLQLNRVWAAVMKKNIPSIEVMKKLGLQQEGTFTEHVLKWGKYEDVVYYGILKAQYEKQVQLNRSIASE